MKRKFLSRKDSTFSLKMITFCKSVKCPTSEDLLDYQKRDALSGEYAAIELHLETCEFCAAEVEFYAHVPQIEETVNSVEIPLPLFQLAEALLSNRKKKFSMLNRLLNENEGLTLNKA